jgi:hypothetical protein
VLVPVLLLGLTVSAVVGLVGAWTADGPERAIGLTDSSVYLGALMAGALGMGVRWLPSVRRWWMVSIALVVCSAAMYLSGSRIALVSSVVVVALALRGPLGRLRWIGLASVIVGVLLALPFGSVSGGSRLVAGLTEGASRSRSGFVPRTEAWKAAGEALLDRPVVGFGPGLFRAVTGPRLSADFARTSTPDFQFFDAHNLFVEYATTLGIVGLGLVVAFGLLAGRRAEGALALFALGIAITWLLEPVSYNTAPLALLALGAAGSPVVTRPTSRLAKTVAGVLVSAAIVAGALVMYGEYQAMLGRENADLAALRRAEQVFRGSAVFSDQRTQFLVQQAQVVPSRRIIDDALESARRTVEIEPDRSLWWSRLGLLEAAWVSLEQGRADYERALELYPWSERALDGLRQVAEAQGDTATVERMNEALCTIESTLCTSGT